MAAAVAFFEAATMVTGAEPSRVTTDGHDSYPREISTVISTKEQVRHRANRYLNIVSSYRAGPPWHQKLLRADEGIWSFRFRRALLLSVTSQLSQLQAAGTGKVYRETVSRAKLARQQLRRALDQLEPGNVLVVTRLDRLARSTRDLLNIIAAIAERKAGFRSLGDTWANGRDLYQGSR